MTDLSTWELRRQMAAFLKEAAQRGSGGWPDPFRDLELSDCDGPAATVVFSYRTQDWMKNVMGVVHGGITATLLDSCMGLLCSLYSGGLTPTISMTVNYPRAVPVERTVLIRARLTSCGSSTAHVMGEILLPEDRAHPLATATGVYYTRVKG